MSRFDWWTLSRAPSAVPVRMAEDDDDDWDDDDWDDDDWDDEEDDDEEDDDDDDWDDDDLF